MLISNGGAINDFQVFYPLGWYVEAGTPLYIHVFVGQTALGGGGTMIGRVAIGGMPLGRQ